MALKKGMDMPSFEGATEWLNDETTVENFIGNPTIVHFWAISCYICKNNMPILATWKQKYAGKVNFVAVHMPRQEADMNVDEVKASIEKYLLTEPCAIDNAHEIGERFETNGYWPYYFLFDAEGKFKSRAAGDVGLTEIEKALERLLSEAPAGA